MGVSAYWLDDNLKDIVQYDFEGPWTWEDLYPVLDKALEMEKEQPHRVDVILNFTNSNVIPSNALVHVKNIIDKQPDNIGLSIFVTSNRFFTVMYNMATKIHPKFQQYFIIVNSFEAAHDLIKTDRETSRKIG